MIKIGLNYLFEPDLLVRVVLDTGYNRIKVSVNKYISKYYLYV